MFDLYDDEVYIGSTNNEEVVVLAAYNFINPKVVEIDTNGNEIRIIEVD